MVVDVESERNDTERQGKEGSMKDWKFGFSEVDADLNIKQFILSALVGVGSVMFWVALKVLLLKGGF